MLRYKLSGFARAVGAAVAGATIAIPATASSTGTDADSTYLRILSDHTSRKAVPHPVSAVPLNEGSTAAVKARHRKHTINVAAVNLEAATKATSSAANASPISSLSAAEAAYVMRTLPAGKVGMLASAADVARLQNECAVVAITRGCHPLVAEVLSASISHCAENDASGFRWYVLDDATPAAVVEAVEGALGIETPERYTDALAAAAKDKSGANAAAGHMEGITPDDGAVPFVVVALQPALNRKKWVMPPTLHTEEDEGAGAGAAAGAGGAVVGRDGKRLDVAALAAAVQDVPEPQPDAASAVSPGLDALMASVPYPSQIADYADAVAAGEAKPTYFGADAPPGDMDPVFPFLRVVVSENFERVVLDPTTDIAVEAYLTNCPMCMCLAPRVRMAAFAAAYFFPDTASVRVAVMNVDDNERPLEWMPGPAFPTIQLFNKGSEGRNALFTKLKGPSCGLTPAQHAAAAAPVSATGSAAVAEQFEAGHAGMPPHSHSPRGGAVGKSKRSRDRLPATHADTVVTTPGTARTTLSTGPVCVPAVDFSHPTVPGKMALPSVAELVTWIASHCSTPFDPAAVRVPADAMLRSAAAFADRFPSPPSAPEIPSGPRASDNTYSLLELCADMDAEARVLEYGVFDLFYFEHLLSTLEKAVGVKAPKEGDEVPPTMARGHPEYNDPVHALLVAPLRARISALRDTVMTRGMYGSAAAAWNQMDATAEFIDTHGIAGIARAYTNAVEEDKRVFAALPLARELAAAEAKDGQSRQARMQ